MLTWQCSVEQRTLGEREKLHALGWSGQKRGAKERTEHGLDETMEE